MIRQEQPRLLGLQLRGWDLVRQVEMEEEIRAQGSDFGANAGKSSHRRASGPGYRHPSVHKHHRAASPERDRD